MIKKISLQEFANKFGVFTCVDRNGSCWWFEEIPIVDSFFNEWCSKKPSGRITGLIQDDFKEWKDSLCIPNIKVVSESVIEVMEDEIKPKEKNKNDNRK